MTSKILPFTLPPAGGHVLVDRAPGGSFTVTTFDAPRAPHVLLTFDRAADAIDYAEDLAQRICGGWALLCDC